MSLPKVFTESERAYIKRRLMDEAGVCLAQFGVRKTTVDELVKRVNIPKGTFYLFYESKEILLFEVINSFHDEIQSDLIKEIDAMNGDVTVDQVTALIFRLYKKVAASFLLPLMTNGEMEFLMRKLPLAVVRDHAERDDLSIERVLALLPNPKAGNVKTFSAALRAVFLSMLHRREIGDEVFDDALQIMIRGVVRQMLVGDAL